jgi:alanyl-tRNA synthetase
MHAVLDSVCAGGSLWGFAMTSADIRQSFLDFFRSKHHTIVPSSSLMPDSPNLLFTNAGMNQFVPIFLDERKPDVSRWPGAIAGSDQRAADTQKCIRAGGKHNDLDDVGLDTYHHTFFEMLGNWSFGDYFKAEAINWAWELVVERWGFPADRLYATIYQPGDGDPAERDTEAWDLWAERFRSAGLDPDVHIVNGNKKDNFWMMGDTGPCGPCSELHFDLTPAGDTRGSLVNAGDARCIEIWNLVFIQFNANPDGTFSLLPARHVDTGMGFERVASIIQGTKGFTDFEGAKVSNYETDIFRPIFDEIEVLSGRRYGSTLPAAGSGGATEQERIDVAFRVIADHIRTLSFAIADGITPGNNDRNYVLRRILRRAVRYGRTLGFHGPFFYKLVDCLVRSMGGVFPELRARHTVIKEVLHMEEEAFNRTLDRGIALFESEAARLQAVGEQGQGMSGAFAFRLYDEQGFPLDLTALMARERGLDVDHEGFETLMNAQRERARAARKTEVISVSAIESKQATQFIGFDHNEAAATVLEVVGIKDQTAVILDQSVCYAEMGGQVGDTGLIAHGATSFSICDTRKAGDTILHFIDGAEIPEPGQAVTVVADIERRRAIERHHSVTHLVHWALHEVVSREASQKGSFVGPDKLTFDFNSAPLSADQVLDIERLVNEKILENAPIFWVERAYAEVRARGDIMQFFGDKYGERVRVVQIGGESGALNGYSMELCGGTHVRGTGEIGLFRIVSEGAIAAGVRRIEAVAGMAAYAYAAQDSARIKSVANRLNAPIVEIEKKIDAILVLQKEQEKQLKSLKQQQASLLARKLMATAGKHAEVPWITASLPDTDGDSLQSVADALKPMFEGVVVLGGVSGDVVSLVATVSGEYTKRIQAGKIIQSIAPLVGGKGGGRPDSARGAGRDAAALDAALDHASTLLS